MSQAMQALETVDRISSRNFDLLARFIYEYCGIKMPPTKQTMLEGRLRRRLRVTGHATLNEYCDFLFNGNGLEQEAIYLIDAVTTNKTDFFREPKHFEYMSDVALPDLVATGVRSIRTWSSACSTGAEPYTMAMVLAEFVAGQRLDYSVLATDLSTDVLATAREGVYPIEFAEPIPRNFYRKYVMTPRQPGRREVRISPRLRMKVNFGRLNLMDEKYPVPEAMHIIFCRNVLIYFDKPTQERVLRSLCNCLLPGGYLFIGHSESTAGLKLPVTPVANTVFKKN